MSGLTPISVRVYYKTDNGWETIPELPVTEIIDDKILLRFNTLTTTHLKFQFIKKLRPINMLL